MLRVSAHGSSAALAAPGRKRWLGRTRSGLGARRTTEERGDDAGAVSSRWGAVAATCGGASKGSARYHRLM